MHGCADGVGALKKADHTDSAFRCLFIRGIYFPD